MLQGCKVPDSNLALANPRCGSSMRPKALRLPIESHAPHNPCRASVPPHQKARPTVCFAVVKPTAPPDTKQAPVEAVLVDSVTVQDLASGVKVLRGLCSNKLRMEVEYMLKHGTSDNSYLISVPGAIVLVDVPYEAYETMFSWQQQHLTQCCSPSSTAQQ
ncbi:flavodoxin-like domain-containing protein, partial [Haematococcus lacustris]